MPSARNADAAKAKESNLYAIRRWVGNSKDWLNAFLVAVCADINIVSVIAMGSAVRERGHRRSDFDLLVAYREKRPYIDAPIEVDVRLYSADTVEEKLAGGNEIVGWAVRFGYPLYDTDQFWQIIEDKWKDRVPLPSASEAAERARKSLVSAQEMLEIGDDSAADDLLLAAATQLVREKLIKHGVFPASRPELPLQLLATCPGDPLAGMLEDCMYTNLSAAHLFGRIKAVGSR